MLEVAMECHGDGSRTSPEQLEETLSKRIQMQPQDDMRGVHDRVIEDTMTTGAKGDDDECGVDRPTLSTS